MELSFISQRACILLYLATCAIAYISSSITCHPLRQKCLINNSNGGHAERCSIFQLGNSKVDTASKEHTATRRNANQNAQNAFAMIKSRYNIESTDATTAELNTLDLSSKEWSKLKRYIYHATSSSSTKKPLSMYQIESVLNFLDTAFDQETMNSNSALNSLFIIQAVPRIFRKDPDSNLRPTVEFLKSLYGAPLFYEFVRKRPEVLLTSGVGYNVPRNKRESSHGNDTPKHDLSVDYYLETQNLGISLAQISKLKEKYPSVFQLPSSKISKCIEYLLSQIVSDNTTTNDTQVRTAVGKVIKANPNILNLSLTNLESKISFFQQECGFQSGEKLMILLNKFPSVLTLSLENNLRPTMELILNLLETSQHSDASMAMTTGINVTYYKYTNDRERLHKTLSSHPQLLALSPTNLLSKIAHFDSIDTNDALVSPSKVEYKAPILAARIAIAAPSVYSLSLEKNIIPKIEMLTKLWGIHNRAPTRSLAKRISEYPNILTLSLDANIRPTVSFYQRTGYITNFTDNEGVDNNGDKIKKNDAQIYLPARYLASSLYNRLLPRWNFYIVQEADRLNKVEREENGDKTAESIVLLKETKKSSSPRIPPLHSIAGATDESFCKMMQYDYATYTKFKKEAIPRLKFSSQFDTWLKTGRPIDLDSNFIASESRPF